MQHSLKQHTTQHEPIGTRHWVRLLVVAGMCLFIAPVHSEELKFGVNNITALYRLALVNDGQFQMDKETQQADMLSPEISRAKLLPQISMTSQYGRIDGQKIRGSAFGVMGSDSYSYNTYNNSINLTQPLFRREYYVELSQSRSLKQRAEIAFKLAKQNLIMRLSEAYFAVLAAQDRLSYAQSEKAAVYKQWQNAEERYKVGSGSKADQKKAHATYELKNAEVIESENALRVNKLALRTIIRSDVSRLASLDDEGVFVAPAPTPSDVEEWVKTALQDNLGLIIKRLDSNIASDEVSRQRAGFLPNIELYARRQEADIRGGPSPRTVRGNEFGVEISVPLFSGGETYYKSKQAAHRYNAAMEDVKHTHIEVEQTMRTQYLHVMTQVKRVKALQEAIASAQLSYETVDAAFRSGYRSSVDVLLSIEDLFEAKRNYSEARYAYILSTLRMKKAAGHLSELDIKKIDRWLK